MRVGWTLGASRGEVGKLGRGQKMKVFDQVIYICFKYSTNTLWFESNLDVQASSDPSINLLMFRKPFEEDLILRRLVNNQKAGGCSKVS